MAVAAALSTSQPSRATGQAGASRSDTVVRTAGAPRYRNGGTLTQELSIGDANGADEYFFSAICNVVVARDRTIWILDFPFSGKPSLRQYDAKGKYLRTVARDGHGPGELEGPTGMTELLDGRILVRDISQNRMNVYTPSGKSDTTWTFKTRYEFYLHGCQALYTDAAGLAWMPFRYPRTGPSTSAREQWGWLRIRADGSIVDTVLTPVLPDVHRPSITITGARGGRTTLGPAWMPSAMEFLHPAGYFGTVRTDRYAIDLLKPRSGAAAWSPGDPVISIRRNVAPVELSSAERAAEKDAMEAWVKKFTGSPEGPIPEIPRTKPFLRYVGASADGNLWAGVWQPSERYQPPVVEDRPGTANKPLIPWREPAAAYDVFETDGAYLGRVSMPPNVGFPILIRGTEVWCISKDSSDVQSLVKYRLNWR